MKKCPYCAEDIQDEAIKCRYCNSMLGQPPAPPAPAGHDDVRQLVLQGRKIDAIKLYRERTGVGLKEAKDDVEAMAAGRAVPARTSAGTSSAPAASSNTGCLVVAVVILIGLVALGYIYGVLGSSSRPDPLAVAPGGQGTSPDAPAATTGMTMRISGDGWFGCADQDAFKKLTQFAVQKDTEAFKSGLGAGILAGHCTMFKNGDEVYVSDTAVFSGLTKVRTKGETREFWTNLEALK